MQNKNIIEFGFPTSRLALAKGTIKANSRNSIGCYNRCWSYYNWDFGDRGDSNLGYITFDSTSSWPFFVNPVTAIITFFHFPGSECFLYQNMHERASLFGVRSSELRMKSSEKTSKFLSLTGNQ